MPVAPTRKPTRRPRPRPHIIVHHPVKRRQASHPWRSPRITVHAGQPVPTTPVTVTPNIPPARVALTRSSTSPTRRRLFSGDAGGSATKRQRQGTAPRSFRVNGGRARTQPLETCERIGGGRGGKLCGRMQGNLRQAEREGLAFVESRKEGREERGQGVVGTVVRRDGCWWVVKRWEQGSAMVGVVVSDGMVMWDGVEKEDVVGMGLYVPVPWYRVRVTGREDVGEGLWIMPVKVVLFQGRRESVLNEMRCVAGLSDVLPHQRSVKLKLEICFRSCNGFGIVKDEKEEFGFVANWGEENRILDEKIDETVYINAERIAVEAIVEMIQHEAPEHEIVERLRSLGTGASLLVLSYEPCLIRSN